MILGISRHWCSSWQVLQKKHIYQVGSGIHVPVADRETFKLSQETVRKKAEFLCIEHRTPKAGEKFHYKSTGFNQKFKLFYKCNKYPKIS